MTRDELLAALPALYTLTGLDWEVTVSASLTEPTCPYARVHPEDLPGFSAFVAWGDTLDEAITSSLALAHQRLIERQPTPRLQPWSNPGDEQEDRLIEYWLKPKE